MHKIILKKLRALTPDWRILSEETGDNHRQSDYTWVVDPLDGTTNFYMGSPLFAVQMALVYKDKPILSLIYAPAINEFYLAEKGKGAFFNNKKIKVSKRNFKQALLTYCHGSDKTAKQLLVDILDRNRDKALSIGVPEVNRQMVSFLLDHGFGYTQPSVRMFLGKRLNYENNIYGILSPEKG